MGGIVVNFFLSRAGPGVSGVGGDLVVDAKIVWWEFFRFNCSHELMLSSVSRARQGIFLLL